MKLRVGLSLLFFLVAPSTSEDNVATICARWYEVPSSKLDIECPPGHVVSVTKAFYGFWKNNNRGLCSYSRDDCTEDAMHVASDACRGKTRCRISVNTPLLHHVIATALDVPRECGGWNDRHDYLQVYYKCDATPDDFVFVSSECTHWHTVNEEVPHPILRSVVQPFRHHMDISCPQDKVIVVKDSFYGWWKNNINRGCRWHVEDCRVDSSTAATSCDGKASCRIPIRRSGNSPKCGQPFFQLRVDHFDYLQVDYLCREEIEPTLEIDTIRM